MDTNKINSDLNKIKALDEIRIQKEYKSGWTYYQAKKKGLLGAYKEFKNTNEAGLKTKKQLTIELVPQTCWFSNIRSIASSQQWNKLKKIAFSKAQYKCEICNSQGTKWPVECHEIWDFNDSIKLQKLMGLVALCPSCHEVKHIGFANTRNRGEIATKHLATVNEWSDDRANKYIHEKFQEWEDRSKFQWTLDIKYLEQYGVIHDSHERKKTEELVVINRANNDVKKEGRIKSFLKWVFVK